MTVGDAGIGIRMFFLFRILHPAILRPVVRDRFGRGGAIFSSAGGWSSPFAVSSRRLGLAGAAGERGASDVRADEGFLP